MPRINTSREFAHYLWLHAALGVAVGVALSCLAVLTNVLGLKDLFLATGEPYVPLGFLVLNSAATVAVAAIVYALIKLTKHD